jgi:hypothetical protein
VPADGLQHAGQAVIRCSAPTQFISIVATLIDSLAQREGPVMPS